MCLTRCKHTMPCNIHEQMHVSTCGYARVRMFFVSRVENALRKQKWHWFLLWILHNCSLGSRTPKNVKLAFGHAWQMSVHASSDARTTACMHLIRSLFSGAWQRKKTFMHPDPKGSPYQDIWHRPKQFLICFTGVAHHPGPQTWSRPGGLHSIHCDGICQDCNISINTYLAYGALDPIEHIYTCMSKTDTNLSLCRVQAVGCFLSWPANA